MLVGDALGVLEAAGADQAVVVGNSFGTVLAYLLAATAPERLLGAVSSTRAVSTSTAALTSRSSRPCGASRTTWAPMRAGAVQPALLGA